ncbi:MAG: helix-turn-helix domain-containing protein [Acidobacteria bacterium]|nr:helix-turn-helix domain-containing protein [Acidobacteriota bacterium]
MGSARPRPERLAGKLLQIRLALGLSQTEMLKRLGAEDLIAYNQISRYESGTREPSLLILLQYARVANVLMEALVDDELDLPERLPSKVKHEGIRRVTPFRRGNRS